jgi:hypothetical protein
MRDVGILGVNAWSRKTQDGEDSRGHNGSISHEAIQFNRAGTVLRDAALFVGVA